MRILLLLTLAAGLFAKSFLISNIPLPSVSLVNLELEPLEQSQIDELYEQGYILTVLAQNNLNKELLREIAIYKKTLNIKEAIQLDLYEVAFFMPQKAIGRYATTTVNSAISTLLINNKDFSLKVYDTNEFEKNLAAIENGSYDVVIAPLTSELAQRLCDRGVDSRFFIPTVHQKSVVCDDKDIYFGAIDYEQQIKSFLHDANSSVTLVSNSSKITKRLDKLVKEHFPVKEHLVLTQTRNLKRQLQRMKEQLHEQEVFINLPLVKATLFLSQLRLYEIEPAKIYTTQILYNPLILKLTQYEDRKNMVIANSIEKFSDTFYNNTKLLKSDVRYDWIDFATAYGLNMIIKDMLTQNQITYDVTHTKALRRNFRIKD